MTEKDRSLNGTCERLAEAVAKLRADDLASLREVKRTFTRLEQAVRRVTRDLDRLKGGIGPLESPPTHVRE